MQNLIRNGDTDHSHQDFRSSFNLKLWLFYFFKTTTPIMQKAGPPTLKDTYAASNVWTQITCILWWFILWTQETLNNAQNKIYEHKIHVTPVSEHFMFFTEPDHSTIRVPDFMGRPRRSTACPGISTHISSPEQFCCSNVCKSSGRLLQEWMNAL